MAIQQQVRFRDPSAFQAPGGLDFRKHLRLHMAEKTRYFEELETLSEDHRAMRLDPRYIHAMQRRWVFSYVGELAAAQYMGRAAAAAPREMQGFITACVCQQMDELHHAEMDHDVLTRIGMADADVWALYEDTDGKKVFNHLLRLEDPFEIAVKGGVFLESASAAIAFPALIRIAEAHGDDLTAANNRTRLTDEPRHMALGVATLKAMLAEDPDNIEVAQRWQDELAVLLPSIVDASREMVDLPQGGFSADLLWKSMVDYHIHTAEKYGLRPSLSL